MGFMGLGNVEFIFKEGDKVRVKDSVKVGDETGLYIFSPEMEQFKGKVFTVGRYDLFDHIELVESPSYGFGEEWLELAK